MIFSEVTFLLQYQDKNLLPSIIVIIVIPVAMIIIVLVPDIKVKIINYNYEKKNHNFNPYLIIIQWLNVGCLLDGSR